MDIEGANPRSLSEADAQLLVRDALEWHQWLKSAPPLVVRCQAATASGSIADSESSIASNLGLDYSLALQAYIAASFQRALQQTQSQGYGQPFQR